MLVCASIIAQTIEAQGDKKSVAALMLVYYAGNRSQSSRSSTTFRSSHLPLPDRMDMQWPDRAEVAAPVFATGRPFVRAQLDRLELAVEMRDLLVRSRATAWRAELVPATPLSAAEIRYGSSPGAGRKVIDVYA
jgi:hypothetical protein